MNVPHCSFYMYWSVKCFCDACYVWWRRYINKDYYYYCCCCRCRRCRCHCRYHYHYYYYADLPTIPKFQEHVPEIWCLFLAGNAKIWKFFPQLFSKSCLCYKNLAENTEMFSKLLLKLDLEGWSHWICGNYGIWHQLLHCWSLEMDK